MWKEIKDFPGYLINENGDVKSVKTNRILKMNKHYEVSLKKEGKVLRRAAHVLLAKTFLVPEGFVLLGCGFKDKVYDLSLNNIWVHYLTKEEHEKESSKVLQEVMSEGLHGCGHPVIRLR